MRDLKDQSLQELLDGWKKFNPEQKRTEGSFEKYLKKANKLAGTNEEKVPDYWDTTRERANTITLFSFIKKPSSVSAQSSAKTQQSLDSTDSSGDRLVVPSRNS